MTVADAAGMKLNVHIQAQRGLIQAFCPDLPGCSAAAPTEAEALALLRKRVDEYFSAPTPRFPGTRVIKLEL